VLPRLRLDQQVQVLPRLRLDQQVQVLPRLRLQSALPEAVAAPHPPGALAFGPADHCEIGPDKAWSFTLEVACHSNLASQLAAMLV